MLTEQEIRKALSLRTRIALSGCAIAVVCVMVYLVFVVHEYVQNSTDFLEAILILLGIPIFLIPLNVAEVLTRRFRTFCPMCGDNVSRYTAEILARRVCPLCDHRIIADGRVRSREVYQRFRYHQARKFLKYWFWVWPVLSLLFLGFWYWDPSSVRRCSHFLVLAPIMGTSAAGWTWCRTFDYRYLPQFLSSVVLLIINAIVYWQSF